MLWHKDKKNDNNEKNMGILDHLDELRNRIIYSALSLVLGCIIAAFFYEPVFNLLMQPFQRVEFRREETVLPIRIQEDGSLKIVMVNARDATPSIDVANQDAPTSTSLIDLTDKEAFSKLSSSRLHLYLPGTAYDPEKPPDLVFGNASKKPVFSSPLDPFFLIVKTVVFLGFLIAFPLIFYQIWLFVNPGMKMEEKRTVVPILMLGSVLFPCGAVFAYFAFGMILDFLLNLPVVGEMEPMLNVFTYLNMEIKLMIGFGIAFEMPIAIMFLAMMGIVDPPRLRKWRPYSILVIAFLSMLLTPPDPLSMLIMMCPLFFLYEFSIILAVPITRKRLKKEEEERLLEEEEDRRLAKLEAERKEKEKAEGTEDTGSETDSSTDASKDEEDHYDGYDDYDYDNDYGYDYEAAQAETKRKELEKQRWKKKKLRRNYRNAKVNKGRGTKARNRAKK